MRPQGCGPGGRGFESHRSPLAESPVVGKREYTLDGIGLLIAEGYVRTEEGPRRALRHFSAGLAEDSNDDYSTFVSALLVPLARAGTMAWSAAISKLQVVRCSRWLAQHGETDERGRLRPEVEMLDRVNSRYQNALARLAMDVPSHLKAGLDLAQGRSLIERMAEESERRRGDDE